MEENFNCTLQSPWEQNWTFKVMRPTLFGFTEMEILSCYLIIFYWQCKCKFISSKSTDNVSLKINQYYVQTSPKGYRHYTTWMYEWAVWPNQPTHTYSDPDNHSSSCCSMQKDRNGWLDNYGIGWHWSAKMVLFVMDQGFLIHLRCCVLVCSKATIIVVWYIDVMSR